MEKRLQDAFDTITMPEDCTDRIEQVLQRRKEGYVARPARRGSWMSAMAAAAAMVVMIFGVGMLTSRLPNPGGEALPGQVSSEDTYRQEVATLQDELDEREAAYQEVEKLLIEGLRYTEGNVTYWTTSDPNTINPGHWYDSSLHSPFTEYVDGRVYFIADGEYLDITDQFSMETPFIYVFTDRYYIVHYIAIGGTPENIGFTEIRWKEWDTQFGFLGGFGKNCSDPETEELYTWYTRAEEQLWTEYGI